jgi:hypothetical protein
MQKPETREWPTQLCKVVATGFAAILVTLFNASWEIREGKPAMTKAALADEIGKAKRDSSMPPARDPSVALAEEYQLAVRQGTPQALELFIARYSDDPLAARARRDLLGMLHR